MSKVIKVLEAMAQLPHAEIEKLVTQANITAEQAEAIINKDVISLERQLDICPDIYCVFFPAEDDEATDKENEDEDDKSDETKSVVNC
jgi:hypothetical protein